MNIKKGDTVEIIAGDDAGTAQSRRTARVLRVLPQEHRIVVEGINRVYRHLKPGRANPQGGRLSKEMPIDVSNALLVCPNCRRGVRVGRRYLNNGSKERYCKSCGNGLGRLSKPRARY